MEEAKKEVIYIPVEDILPNRFQPRLTFDEKDLNELANSIIKYGVIQPIVVRRMESKYEIIAGERRYKASVIAGLKKIPAVLMSTDDNTSAEIALLENLQRKNLTPIEEAKAYKKLMDKGFTQEDIATKLGVSQPLVANKIRLLNLPEEVQNALLYNQVSERHARSLLALNDKDLQNNLLKRIISEKLTVKQTEDEINLIIGVRGGDTVIESEIPADIQKFLEPQKEELLLEEDNKEQKEKDIIDDMEFIDLKVPNVIDIVDDPIKNEYTEEQPLVNPFQQPDLSPGTTDIEPVVSVAKPEDIEAIPKTEEIDMPFSPFTEQSIDLAKELTEEKQEEPQKSIKDQLGEVKYEYKPPTVEDLNISEDYNKIERIDADAEKIESEKDKESIDDELKNEYGEIDLPKVINKVRDFANNLGSASAIMEVSEVDLPDKYQITIDIKKD